VKVIRPVGEVILPPNPPDGTEVFFDIEKITPALKFKATGGFSFTLYGPTGNIRSEINGTVRPIAVPYGPGECYIKLIALVGKERKTWSATDLARTWVIDSGVAPAKPAEEVKPGTWPAFYEAEPGNILWIRSGSVVNGAWTPTFSDDYLTCWHTPDHVYKWAGPAPSSGHYNDVIDEFMRSRGETV